MDGASQSFLGWPRLMTATDCSKDSLLVVASACPWSMVHVLATAIALPCWLLHTQLELLARRMCIGSCAGACATLGQPNTAAAVQMASAGCGCADDRVSTRHTLQHVSRHVVLQADSNSQVARSPLP